MNSEMKNVKLTDRLKVLMSGEKPYPWAKKIGVTQATFNRIWKEGVIPKGDTLLLISRQTGCSIDWLLTGEGPMHRDQAPAAAGGSELDQAVLQSAIETVEEILELTGRKPTHQEKARAIVIVYEYFLEDDHTVKDTGQVLRLVRDAI